MKTVERGPLQRNIVLTISVLLVGAAGVSAQTPTDPRSSNAASPGIASAVTAVSPVVPNEAEALQKRMERARALAAAHQLTLAATELESIRASAKDEMSRNVSSLMLMGIYLEEGNYARAESMLEETYKQRTSKNEGSVRTFFALAGQAVNGARAHVARYRTFGINVSTAGLPAEAMADLDRLCSLLERMTAQSKELLQQNARDNDAFALLEDLSGIRATLARDNDDRARWQNEYSAARARLATLPTEVASVGSAQPLPNTASAPSPGSSEAARDGDGPSQAAAADEASAPVTNIGKKAGSAPSMLEVGSLIEKATKKVVPLYPQTAKTVGASGLVRVKVVVDESGSVSSIVWTEGPMLLRQAAQDAVRQWKFQPVVVDGKPVRAAGFVDFGFSR